MIDPSYPTNKAWHEADGVVLFVPLDTKKALDEIHSKCEPYCYRGTIGIWDGDQLIETVKCPVCGETK